MSKTKRKSHDELEHYRGLLKEAEKKIRSLEQELKRFKKHDNLYENNKDEIQEILHKQTESKKYKDLEDCPECFKGKMQEMEIIGRVYATCEVCGFRKRNS